ncbi:tyrosine-protein phosphatase [Phenylobacterium aquaticum]|uniref:tyrosine-protein phosphatase n=1 Tax=Phenylobacterium aquaticum TaxID=1763816 RepID=UPI001F5D0221|nr:tyrosine-protein phosphatase [Phenylobacterium aquaticum]MCI3134221.1 tyrosine-protein phosphatase [Phenylobacterium aquaticum]
MTRHIPLEGVENFRDFGGYDTACGRGLKRGVLYRSANHANATEADLATMRDLGVEVIVDLRRPLERQREPSRRWEGFSGRVIENDIEDVHGDWATQMASVPDIDANWFYEDSIGFYRKGPFEARHVDLFSRYFQALAETDGAVVVHCAAGKDRTGMICAFTHHIAGVHRDDLISDYLATNHEGRILHRVNFLRDYIKNLTGKTVSDEALRVAVSVHEDYLDTALSEIEARCGTMDNYLRDVLGVDDAHRQRIADKILA